jgi:hypothetical protein
VKKSDDYHLRLWENTLLLKRRRDDPADELKKNMKETTEIASAAEKIAKLAWAAANSRTPLADNFRKFEAWSRFVKFASQKCYEESEYEIFENEAMTAFQFAMSIANNEYDTANGL